MPVLCPRPPLLRLRSNKRSSVAGVTPAQSELLPHRLLLPSKTSVEDRMTCLAMCGVDLLFSASGRDGCALAYDHGWKSM